MEAQYPTMRTCAFTGHRPEKLPWGDNEADPGCVALKRRMLSVLRELYTRGIRHFISGMARGSDFYFCELILKLRDLYHDITVEAAVPFREQSHSWSVKDRSKYDYLLSRCDKVTVVQEEYTKGCMQKRNKYMVDRSSVLLAVLSDSEGGTKSTVDYAMRQGIEVFIFDPRSDVYVNIPMRFDLI